MKNTIAINTLLNGKIQKTSKEEKMEFFETMKYVSIKRFIDMSGDILEFIVDLKIVENIIAQLFLSGCSSTSNEP